MDEKERLGSIDYFKYVFCLKQKYFRLCPYDENTLRSLLLQTIGEVGILSGLSILVLFLWNCLFEFSFGYFCCSIGVACYLIAMEVPNYKIQKKESRLFEELILYLARVKHQYLWCRHIPNAVLEAAEGMSYEMQRLAGELYRILMEGDRKDKIREYVQYGRTNRYMKLFLVQAYEASEKGEVILTDGRSLFSENVEHLRMEIMETLYRRKKRTYEFAGYLFVTIIPVFMMPVLKQWGLDFVPELDFFYAGMGKLLEVLTFSATIIIYGFINRIKEMELSDEPIRQVSRWQQWVKKISWLEMLAWTIEKRSNSIGRKTKELLLQSGEQMTFGVFITKMLALAVGGFLLLVSFSVSIHFFERQSVMNSVSAIGSIAPLASIESREEMEEQILKLVKEYRKQAEVPAEVLTASVRKTMITSSYAMETAIVKEIQNKLEQYQSATVSWKELLICFIGSLFFAMLPLIRLYYQVRISLDGAKYEVKQFQSIIIMERQLQGATIIGLLEDMEVFSRLFKPILRRCINAYSSGPERALCQMKEEGGKLHESFAELADSFLAVDEVGISLAFAEVEHNRELMEKMERLEAEINLEKKKDSTDLLSKIPMVLAVGAYFIFPFFIHSMRGVMEVFELLEELQI